MRQDCRGEMRRLRICDLPDCCVECRGDSFCGQSYDYHGDPTKLIKMNRGLLHRGHKLDRSWFYVASSQLQHVRQCYVLNLNVHFDSPTHRRLKTDTSDYPRRWCNFVHRNFVTFQSYPPLAEHSQSTCRPC